MSSQHDLIADAGRGMTATAKAADTGERWTLYQQYDAQYVVDLKPSVPWVRDERGVRPRYVGIPDCAFHEDPADFSVVHEHADHITGLDPEVGMDMGHLLNVIAKAQSVSLPQHTNTADGCPRCWVDTVIAAAETTARTYLRPEGDA